GNLVYTSGQLPIAGGKLTGTGKVGAEISPEEGKALARLCALNALAAVGSLADIDPVTRVGKGGGFVASPPGFNGQPHRRNGGAGVARGGVRGQRRACALGGRCSRATTGRARGGRVDSGGRLAAHVRYSRAR